MPSFQFHVTIELGYNDWCIQQLALRLGEKDKAEQLEFRINDLKISGINKRSSTGRKMRIMNG